MNLRFQTGEPMGGRLHEMDGPALVAARKRWAAHPEMKFAARELCRANRVWAQSPQQLCVGENGQL